MKEKSELVNTLKQLLTEYNSDKYPSISKLKIILTDCASESFSEKFLKVLEDNNIILQTSAPYKHQQNLVERYIAIFKDGVRTIMAYNNAPKDLWCFAVESFIHVYNKTPRSGSTLAPDEKFFNKKPDVSSFVPFYSTGYYHVTKDERKKKDALKTQSKEMLHAQLC